VIWVVKAKFPSDIVASFSTREEAQSKAMKLNDEFQTANYVVREPKK
jgi:hypothetical protein